MARGRSRPAFIAFLSAACLCLWARARGAAARLVAAESESDSSLAAASTPRAAFGLPPTAPAPLVVEEEDFATWRRRRWAVACALRPDGHDGARTRTLLMVRRAVDELGLRAEEVLLGEVSEDSRSVGLGSFAEVLANVRVVVTAQPSRWEGDSRTWEALAAGAAVMTDPTWSLVDHPLEDGEHVLYFAVDSSEEAYVAFRDRLRRLLEDDEDAGWAMAQRGRAFALAHHRPVARMDTLLRRWVHAATGSPPAS